MKDPIRYTAGKKPKHKAEAACKRGKLPPGSPSAGGNKKGKGKASY